jgi:hypothetical protein
VREDRGSHEVAVRPRVRRVLTLHPIYPIDKDENGGGGGVVCRLYGEGYEPTLVRIVWGESTEIEILEASA